MKTTLFSPADLRRQSRATLAPFGQFAQSSSLAAQFYASPDWWQLRSAIMAALQDFPEARQSVIDTLRALHALENPDARAA